LVSYDILSPTGGVGKLRIIEISRISRELGSSLERLAY